MAKTNICYHSLRLNMDNEQHQRVEKVLANLNTEIHKSVNKFIVDSIDFYISSLDGENLVTPPGGKKEKEYLTREDLAGIYADIREQARDEVVRMLGIALAGSRPPAVTAVPLNASAGTENMEGTEDSGSLGTEEDHIMAELASGWG